MENNATKPVSLVAFTIGYVLIVVLIFWGFPAPNTGILVKVPQDFRVEAAGIAILLYLFLVAVLKIIDRFKKNRRLL